MISEVNVIDQIVNRADACRKYKLDPKHDIRPVVEKIFSYLKYFNSIQEFDSCIFNFQRFDEVQIPNEFVPFIYPKSVKYVPGLRMSTDVLIREEIPTKMEFTMEEWVDLCSKWRSFFKKDFRTDVTSLATIKVDKSVVDVLSNAVFTFKADKEVFNVVRYESAPFIPVPLDSRLMMLYRNDYYNASYDEIVRDYLSTQMYN